MTVCKLLEWSELFTLLQVHQILHQSVLKSQTELSTNGCIRERDVSLTRGDLPSVKSKQIQPTGGRSIVTVTGTGAQIYRGSLCLDSRAFDYVSIEKQAAAKAQLHRSVQKSSFGCWLLDSLPARVDQMCNYFLCYFLYFFQRRQLGFQQSF